MKIDWRALLAYGMLIIVWPTIYSALFIWFVYNAVMPKGIAFLEVVYLTALLEGIILVVFTLYNRRK